MVENFEGKIETGNLEAFLKSCGHEPTDLELLAIIRRMDADGDATVTFNEWADFLRPIAALAKPEPLLSYLGPYPSWRHRYGYWPYHSSWRYSHWPYTRPYLPTYTPLYRPYYRSYLSTYVPPAPAYVPPARTLWPSVTYSAPRYTHTTYEPAGTVTEYVPKTVTTYEPVTTYHTRVVPDYKLVTERTEYVTTPVRTSLYYSPYYHGYSSPYYSRYYW